jgi:hypothetical protein
MNFIFHEKLDVFIIIYIDDILVYTHHPNELYLPCKKNVEHLEYVLSKLWQNKLFANRAKSEFAQEEMDFLGHILSREGALIAIYRFERKPIMDANLL